MANKEKAKEKKRLSGRKIVIIALAAAVAAMLITFLALHFVPYKSFSDGALSDYNYVHILDGNGDSIGAVYKDGAETSGENGQRLSALLNEGIKSTGYTALRAAFEFNYKNKPRFKTKQVTTSEPQYDDSGVFTKFSNVTKTLRDEVKGGEIAAATQAGDGEILIEAHYGSVKSIKVEGETVSFDRMRVVVYDTENTLDAFELYLYVYDEVMIDSGASETTPKKVTPVIIQANSSKLYGNLSEIKKLLT
jgi:hypothetical protein